MQNSSFALEYLLLEVREHFFGLFYLVCPPDHGEGSSFKLGGFDAVIIPPSPPPEIFRKEGTRIALTDSKMTFSCD